MSRWKLEYVLIVALLIMTASLLVTSALLRSVPPAPTPHTQEAGE